MIARPRGQLRFSPECLGVCLLLIPSGTGAVGDYCRLRGSERQQSLLRPWLWPQALSLSLPEGPAPAVLLSRSLLKVPRGKSVGGGKIWSCERVELVSIISYAYLEFKLLILETADLLTLVANSMEIG